MKRRAYFVFIVFSMILVMGLFLPEAYAQKQYPTRPVEIVCPYPPGGGCDLTMRVIVATGGQYLGRPFIPVIKSGATGTIAAAYVAHAKPDGYTLLLGAPAHMTFKLIVEDLPYKPEDFIPLGQFSGSPQIINVLSTSPYKTLKDLIEDAKKRPGKVRYSSGGAYDTEHLIFGELAQLAGIKLLHVPMGGGGPAMAAVLGGHVEASAQLPAVVSGNIEGGIVRPLGVSGAERLKIKGLEKIPTLTELGYPIEVYLWMTLFAPKDTPKPVCDKIKAMVKQIVEDKSYKKLMGRMGEEIKYMSGESFAAYWNKELEEKGKLIRSLK